MAKRSNRRVSEWSMKVEGGTPEPNGETSGESAGEGRELERALQSFSRWARDEGVGDDPGVIRLEKGLKARQNLSMWAMKDIDSFLPAPRPRERRTITTLARLLLFARNVGVFLPIVVTWRAISLASESFAAFAAFIPEGDDVNFLRYWQTGGEGLLRGVNLPPEAILPELERLSTIAFLAASIIAVIIGLTVVAEILSWNERSYRTKEQRRAEQVRMGIVLELESALHGYRQATPTSISESLAESLSALLQAAHQLGATAKQLEGSTKGVSELGPAIAGFTAQLASAEQRFSAELTPSLSQLAFTVDSISSKIGASYDETLKKSMIGIETLGGTMEQLMERVQRTSATVEIGTQKLKADIDEILMKLGRF